MSWQVKLACPSCKQVVTPPQYSSKLRQMIFYFIVSLAIIIGMNVLHLYGGWIFFAVWFLVLLGFFNFRLWNRQLTCPNCNNKILPETDFTRMNWNNKRTCPSCFHVVIPTPPYKSHPIASFVMIAITLVLFIGSALLTPYFEKKPEYWEWGKGIALICICFGVVVFFTRKFADCPNCKNKLYQ